MHTTIVKNVCMHVSTIRTCRYIPIIIVPTFYLAHTAMARDFSCILCILHVLRTRGLSVRCMQPIVVVYGLAN